MQIQKAAPIHELLAKALFLLLPTWLVCYFFLWNANQYYTLLNQQTTQQAVYLAIGMAVSAILYTFRIRFLPTFVLLAFVLYLVYKGIDASSIGEFDTFFLSIQFRVFSITFLTGWLIGWGFVRLRFFSIFSSALFLSGSILVMAKRNELFSPEEGKALQSFAMIFGPVALYAIYTIFTAELIHNYKDKSRRFWGYLSGRLALFVLLALLLLGGTLFFLSGPIEKTLSEFGGGGAEGKNSMLKKNKDNTFDLEKYTTLRGSLGRSNELLFAAHIDNFFPGTDVPNPLYLTAFYYSKFDTLTETFERDSLLPDSDLFEPDPSNLPLFFIRQDSSVLHDALRQDLRRTVDIEVYKKQLSPNSFVAPSTSFFIQPITIEKDFQQEFQSAYRAKSYISELNSAYFVYNASENPDIDRFQQQRFEVLRKVKGYEGVSRRLMDYYTYMPNDAKFNRIKELARKIEAGKTTPIDRILAIRDYFLSKDENGDPLFQYTDNPGVPDIPNASKLQYFLFENRKGYCAYYAGATLFLLRSLGIPSRITVGFMTVDRSNKNKGWYWYYADQAHAWVQVYFPGYGWLDFDTTVGNDDAQESPAPDGTPPMQPPKAYFAGEGKVLTLDTLSKTATARLSRMVYHDKEFRFDSGSTVTLDLSIATIRLDSMEAPLSQLHTGDSVMAVSYAEAFHKIAPKNGEGPYALKERMPAPAPIDELYVKSPKAKEQELTEEKQKANKGIAWKTIFMVAFLTALSIVLVLAFLPRIILAYYQSRRKMGRSLRTKAYWSYRSASFYLHQLGFSMGDRNALQFATDVDLQLGTRYAAFIKTYHKLKYAPAPVLTTEEKTGLDAFYPDFKTKVRAAFTWKSRQALLFHVLRCIAFFARTDR